MVYRCTEETEPDKDETSLVSHDDSLARERQELFTRLDELNKECVVQKTSSPTVANFIRSSARSGTSNSSL